MRDAQQSVHLVAATVGFLSYGSLWLTIVLGVVLKNGWALSRMRHATMYGIHQTVTLLGLTLGVVHALAQLAVPGGPVRLLDQVIPFTNPVDPVGIGFGVIALEVLVALAASVLLQRRIGHHRWRRLHLLSYVAYVLLTLHVLLSGSDTGSLLVRLPVIASSLVVVALAFFALVPRAASGRLAPPSAVADMALNVDPGRCVRYGFCTHEAPDLFRLDTDGRMRYRASVPPDQAERALRAAEACPARAIMLGRKPTAVVLAGDAPESATTTIPPTAGHTGSLHGIDGGRVGSGR